MRYEEFVTVGDHSKTITYEGTPQEIHELIKLQKIKNNVVQNLTVHVNGEDVAKKVRAEIEKGLQKLESYS